MDTTNLLAPLAGMRRALDGLLSLETRQHALSDITPGEVILQAEWQLALDPALSDLYWWPLRNGIDDAPEDEDELRAWLWGWYGDPLAAAALATLLFAYSRRGVNLGGATGLALLSLGGRFALTRPAYLRRIETHVQRLTRRGTRLSLLDTTVANLLIDIPAARADAMATAVALNSRIRRRVELRRAMIADTELARFFATGLGWSFLRNAVAEQIFVTRGDDRVCELCAPLDGVRVPVNNVPSEMEIPIHVFCRCGWLPVLDGWDPPETVWRGE